MSGHNKKKTQNSKLDFSALFDNDTSSSSEENYAPAIIPTPPSPKWQRQPKVKQKKTPKLPFEASVKGKVGELSTPVLNQERPTIYDITAAYTHFLEPISQVQAEITPATDVYNHHVSKYAPDSVLRAKLLSSSLLTLQGPDLDVNNLHDTVPFTYFGVNHNGKIMPLRDQEFLRVHPEHNQWLLNQYSSNYQPPNLTYLANVYWYVLEGVEKRKRSPVWKGKLTPALIDQWRDELAVDFFINSLQKQCTAPFPLSPDDDFMLNPCSMAFHESHQVNSDQNGHNGNNYNPHLHRLHTTKARFHHKYDTATGFKATDNGKIIQFYIGSKQPVVTRVVDTTLATFCLLEPLEPAIYAVVDYGRGEYALTWIPEHFFIEYGLNPSDYKPSLGHVSINVDDVHEMGLDKHPDVINFALKLYNQSVVFMTNTFKRDAISHLNQYQASSELTQPQHRTGESKQNVIPTLRCKSCFQPTPAHLIRGTFNYHKTFRVLLDEFLIDYCGNDGRGLSLKELQTERESKSNNTQPLPLAASTQSLFRPTDPTSLVEAAKDQSQSDNDRDIVVVDSDNEQIEKSDDIDLTNQLQAPSTSCDSLFSLIIAPPSIEYQIAEAIEEVTGYKITDDEMLAQWTQYQTIIASQYYRLDCLGCYNRALSTMAQFRETTFQRIIELQNGERKLSDEQQDSQSPATNSSELREDDDVVPLKNYSRLPYALRKGFDGKYLGDGRDTLLSYALLDEQF